LKIIKAIIIIIKEEFSQITAIRAGETMDRSLESMMAIERHQMNNETAAKSMPRLRFTKIATW